MCVNNARLQPESPTSVTDSHSPFVEFVFTLQTSGTLGTATPREMPACPGGHCGGSGSGAGFPGCGGAARSGLMPPLPTEHGCILRHRWEPDLFARLRRGFEWEIFTRHLPSPWTRHGPELLFQPCLRVQVARELQKPGARWPCTSRGGRTPERELVTSLSFSRNYPQPGRAHCSHIIWSDTAARLPLSVYRAVSFTARTRPFAFRKRQRPDRDFFELL